MVFAINPAASLPAFYDPTPRPDVAPVSAVPPLGAVLGQSPRTVTARGAPADGDTRRNEANRQSFRSALSTATEDAAPGQSVRPANLALAADLGTSRVLLRAQAERPDFRIVVLPPPTPSPANDADADGVLDTRDLAPNYAITGTPRVFGYGSVAALAPTAAATGQMVALVG